MGILAIYNSVADIYKALHNIKWWREDYAMPNFQMKSLPAHESSIQNKFICHEHRSLIGISYTEVSLTISVSSYV